MPKTPSRQDIEAILKQARANLKKAGLGQEAHNASPKARVGTCVVCRGVVTEEFVQTTDTPLEMLPIGPGSHSHFYWSSQGLACVKCGLMYARVPGEK